MTTETSPEYRVRLDRDRCEGIFACLVRDDRFLEADDGLATVEGADESVGADETDGTDGTLTATFANDRFEDAQRAARACPVGAIDAWEVTDE